VGSILTTGTYNLNNSVRGLLDDEYIKYEKSGLCSFRQEDFWKMHFENLFFTPWPTFASNYNGLNTFGRRLPWDHSIEVWSNSNQRFQRCYVKMLTLDARIWTTDKDLLQYLTLKSVIPFAVHVTNKTVNSCLIIDTAYVS